MKKIIILAIAAVTAVCANAATVNWGANKGYVYNGTAEQKLTSGTAYLMIVTSTYTQTDLVDAFNTANGDVAATIAAMTASGAMAAGTAEIGANGRIPIVSSTGAPSADFTAYFVVFNDNKMYVSITGEAIYDAVSAESTLNFATVSASSKTEFAAADGYSAAGWYTAVPEPTSGLLMLVGLAGLALRRRRA